VIENFKLHVFRVVAETLNFSMTAEEIHLSQSAVRSRLTNLDVAALHAQECHQHYSGLCEMVLHGVHLDVIIAACWVRMLGENPALNCLKSADRRKFGDKANGRAAVAAVSVCPAAIAMGISSDTAFEGQYIFTVGQGMKDCVNSGVIAGT